MADNNQQPVAEQDIREILQIRRDKLKQLRELGQDPFVQTRYEVTAHSSQIQEQFAQMEGSTVSLAGRLMAKRGWGRYPSATCRTGTGVSRSMCARTTWGRTPTLAGGRWTLGTLWACGGLYSAPRRERSPCMCRSMSFCPNPSFLCRRSSMASRTRRHGTGSGMWT